MKRKEISASAALVALVCVVVAATVITGFVLFFSLYENTVRDLVAVNSSQAVVQACRTMENYIDEIQETMEIIRYSCAEEEGKREQLIENIGDLRSDIEALYFYDDDGSIFYAWLQEGELKEIFIKNMSYREWDRDYPDDTMYISEPHVENLITGHYPWVLSIMQQMEDCDGNRILAVMDIRFSEIARYVDMTGIGRHGYCFLVDTEGNIVYHPQQQFINTGLKSENLAWIGVQKDGVVISDNVVYAIQTVPGCAWRVVGVSYLDELVSVKPREIALLFALAAVAVLITACIGSAILTRLVSRPVRQLIAAMRAFETDASGFCCVNIRGSREILELAKSFEHMVWKIQDLMVKIRHEELTLRKSELKALQAQINPHFLYNTLDSISWMCEEGRNTEAAEMINALSKLFRISISKGEELIPVKNEVEHAKSYLLIQKFRYKNQFVYHFDVQESCLNYLCNKITLEPFIENAIYHGINRMVDEGCIDIRVFEEDEDLIFEVEDNGIGMSKGQCETVLSGSAADVPEDTRTGGIGIKNVNSRVKIYFGEAYGVSIVSEPDEGTCVRIRIPKVTEGTYHGR